jgi:hypothetical protein
MHSTGAGPSFCRCGGELPRMSWALWWIQRVPVLLPILFYVRRLRGIWCQLRRSEQWQHIRYQQ